MSKKHFNKGADRFTITPPPTENISSKISADLSGGKNLASDIFQIPCREITPFTLKDAQGFDFSPWAADRYDELLVSIQEHGVLQPIIIRPIPNGEETGFHYEVLAGEHRLKASIDLKIKTIPAKLMDPCDDDKAKSIFVLTNMIRRDLTVTDKIYGWGHYYGLTQGKAEKTIQGLQEEGIILDYKADVSRRQLIRYHKVTQLIPDLRKLFEAQKIALKNAEIFHNYSMSDQALIVTYKEWIKSQKDVQKIIDLYKGEVEGHHFDDDGFEYIFKNQEPQKTFSTAISGAKPIIKAKLKEEDYTRVQEVLGTALDIYYAMPIKTLELASGYENTDLTKFLSSDEFHKYFIDFTNNN